MVRRSNATGSGTVIVALILAAVILAPNLFGIGEGSLFLNIQKADFIANNQDVGGPAWLVTLAVNGQGQSGILTTNLVDEESGKTQDVKLSADLESQECRYFAGEQTNIQHLKRLTIEEQKEIITTPFIDIIGSETAFRNECFDAGGAFVVKPTNSFLNICLKYQNDARVGRFIDTQKFTSMKVSVDGKSVVVSSDEQSVALPDGYGRVIFGGSLLSSSGFDCPPSTGITPVWKGGWKTVDSSRVATALSASTQASIEECLRQGTGIQLCINKVDQAVNDALQISEINPQQRISNNKVYIDKTSTPVSNGVLQLTINAEKVTNIVIEESAGDPELSNPSCAVDSLVGRGKFSTELTNKGGDGSFFVSLECGGDVTGQTTTISLPAGATETFTFNAFSSTDLVEAEFDCTIKAKDFNSLKEDVVPVTCEVAGGVINEQGEWRCSQGKAEQYQGTDWVVVYDCAGNNQECTKSGGVASCVGGNPKPTNDPISNPPLDLNLILIIGAVLIAAFVLTGKKGGGGNIGSFQSFGGF